MKGAKVEEVRTESGRALGEFCSAIAPFGEPTHYVLSESILEKIAEHIIGIEAEARSAALAEVEEAVSRVALYDEHDRIVTMRGTTRPVETRADAAEALRTRVLAAIHSLQEKSA